MHRQQTYPAGLEGAALLLLRACVAFGVSVPISTRFAPAWLLLSGFTVGVALLAGRLTRSAALCAALLGLVLKMWLNHDLSGSSNIITAVSLAILGPGAYSIDGRLFGRRVLRLPHRAYSESSPLDQQAAQP